VRGVPWDEERKEGRGPPEEITGAQMFYFCYEPRELMSHIMYYDNSLERNDIIKFVYYSMILFFIYL
jgi:hypothetical protein